VVAVANGALGLDSHAILFGRGEGKLKGGEAAPSARVTAAVATPAIKNPAADY